MTLDDYDFIIKEISSLHGEYTLDILLGGDAVYREATVLQRVGGLAPVAVENKPCWIDIAAIVAIELCAA